MDWQTENAISESQLKIWRCQWFRSSYAGLLISGVVLSFSTLLDCLYYGRFTLVPLWLDKCFQLFTWSMVPCRLVVVLSCCVGVAEYLYVTSILSHHVAVPPLRNFLRFNLLADGSALYGSHPWHWYFTEGLAAAPAQKHFNEWRDWRDWSSGCRSFPKHILMGGRCIYARYEYAYEYQR